MPYPLSTLLVLPLAGALWALLTPRSQTSLLRGGAFLLSLLTFAFSLCTLTGATLPADEIFSWIPSLGIRYHLSANPVSALLILLTTLLFPLVFLFLWDSKPEGQKRYFFLMFFLEGALIGTFLATDLLLFYLFWEAMLIPSYFLIGIFGSENKNRASFKFFVYTLLASAGMLVALILWQTSNTPLALKSQGMLLLAFAIAFAVKTPLFPFHTWQPQAYQAAPPAVAAILAALLSKAGIYGFYLFISPFLRGGAHIEPTFQLQKAQMLLLVLALIGVLYGALLALVQTGLKRLLAYSSLSHLGLILFGIFTGQEQSVQGALYQMLNHGIIIAGLFLLVGMLEKRVGTDEISSIGGLAQRMPLFAFFFLVMILASIAVPGTNGFIGEFLIFVGAFQKFPKLSLVAAATIVLSASYMLWMVRRVLFGALVHPAQTALSDLRGREIALLVPLAILIFGMGLYPKPVLNQIGSGGTSHQALFLFKH